MKKFLIALGIISLISITEVLAEDWKYFGVFSAPRSYDYKHDSLILNHLRPFNRPGNNLRYFNVYYDHSHENDERKANEHMVSVKINISGKIVPLDRNTLKELTRGGIDNAYVVSNVDIANKGAFGVIPRSLAVYDSVSHKVLYNASGEMGSQILWSNSAALYIVNISGPHPVWNGIISSTDYSEYERKY